MIDRARIGVEYVYQPNRGVSKRVKCIGFRRNWIECEGVEDGRHRSISMKQLTAVASAP